MKLEIEVLIADDHPIFRQGLRQVIERDARLRVVGEAEDGMAALAKLRELGPDLALIDIDMPHLDGFAVARTVRDERLPVKVVFLTMHKDELHVRAALDIGVQGYLLKDSAAADAVACIHAVAAGQNYLSPTLATYLLDRGRRRADLSRQEPRLITLTPSERRILVLLAEHRTNRDIAEALCVSVRTVENHRANICAKLGLHGPHALLKFAVDHRSELA